MKRNQFNELTELLKIIIIMLGAIFGLLLAIMIFMPTKYTVYAAPIAGATYQTHVQTMRAPVAPWQQDILETINEEPKEETKDDKKENTKSIMHVSKVSNSRNTNHLTKRMGVFNGPSGRETFYNLPMGQCVRYMDALGFSGRYWIREDGVKMFGDYVMCAADLSIRPKGTILETSLGTGIVCDTGEFVNSNRYQLDIATNW